MKIEIFEMERMQSTWENVADYDLSESGIRALISARCWICRWDTVNPMARSGPTCFLI